MVMHHMKSVLSLKNTLRLNVTEYLVIFYQFLLFIVFYYILQQLKDIRAAYSKSEYFVPLKIVDIERRKKFKDQN